MSPAFLIPALFGLLAVVFGGLWIASALNRAHLKPRDLADDYDPFDPSQWP